MGRISWWVKEFPGGKDFLVEGNSQWEGFPGGKEFLV